MRNRIREVRWNENSLGHKLGDIRKELDNLSKPSSSFTNPITVFALQQGIGKTHMFIEYAKKHWKKEKIVFASPRHDHLNESMDELGEDKAKHWYGFAYKDDYGYYRGCPKLNQNISIVNNLKKEKEYNRFLSPKTLCDILCSQRKCRYHRQFGKTKKVDLIPLEYLGTDLLLNQNPDIVFIDESIDKITKYWYDSTDISNCIAIAQNYGYTQLSANLNSLIPKPSKGSIGSSLLDSIENDKNDLMTDCIRIEDFNDAMILSKLDSIIKYLRQAPSYTNDYYYHPMIYDAFDIAYQYEIKVVFLNASFHKELFTYFLETYPNQIGNVTIPIYTSDIINPKSTLIRVYPDNKFWKGAFKSRGKARRLNQRTLNQIFEVIRKIEEYIPREKIGIITYEKVKYWPDGKEEHLMVEEAFQKKRKKRYDTLHFWDESGLNILEDKYVLFVIGTPFIPTDDLINKWEETHDEKTNLKEEDIGGRDIGYTYDEEGNFVKVGEGGYEVLDVFLDVDREYDIGLIRRRCIDQIIDSIHRCRPLTHDRIVVALGDVPKGEYLFKDKDGKYVSYKDINPLIGMKYRETDDLDELEEIIEDHNVVRNSKIRKDIEFVLDNRGHMKNRDIARALHLWDKNGNPNVNLIKKVEEGIDAMDEEVS